MSSSGTTRRFIVLPAYGFRGEALRASALQVGARELRASPRSRGTHGATMRTIDAIGDDGPKLVEMSVEAELQLRLSVPGLKIIPEVRYRTAQVQIGVAKAEVLSAAAQTTSLAIVGSADNSPVAGARVIAFTDFRHRIGAEAISDAAGRLSLPLSPGTALDRFYVLPKAGHWSRLERSIVLVQGQSVELKAIDCADPNLLLAQFRMGLPSNAGEGVTVAIIDTGIARHDDLPNLAGGANMVGDETRDDVGAVDDFGPARIDGEHGTHVAGIVAANGVRTAGLLGVAPGATLRACPRGR